MARTKNPNISEKSISFKPNRDVEALFNAELSRRVQESGKRVAKSELMREIMDSYFASQMQIEQEVIEPAPEVEIVPVEQEVEEELVEPVCPAIINNDEEYNAYQKAHMEYRFKKLAREFKPLLTEEDLSEMDNAIQQKAEGNEAPLNRLAFLWSQDKLAPAFEQNRLQQEWFWVFGAYCQIRNLDVVAFNKLHNLTELPDFLQ